MSEIDAVLYEYVKSIHVIYMDFFCFQASTALCISMSTYANSWIKVAARRTQFESGLVIGERSGGDG
jgi:hypothetical protein